MGTYIYKTTAKTVTLRNGEKASVAVYAYKPSFWDEGGKTHTLSGAAACDRAAKVGKREDWTIMGSLDKETGIIRVDVTSAALRTGPLGSFSDDWFDMKVSAIGPRMTAVSAGKGVVLTQTLDYETGPGEGDSVSYDFLDGKWVETGRRKWRSLSFA